MLAMIIKWHRQPMADGVVAMIIKRRRFKQAMTLERRLLAEAEKLRSEAAGLPPSFKREQLFRKARQHEAAADMAAWISSPDLKSCEQASASDE
jgi:hypothetical protein